MSTTTPTTKPSTTLSATPSITPEANKVKGARHVVALPYSLPGGILVLCLLATIILLNPADAADKATQSINIEVTTHLGDKQKFKAGDKIAFLVSLDKDAHLLMIYEDANHNLIQIIPNDYRKMSLYKKGLFIAVPDRKEPFEFLVNPPFGTEKLWVFASSKQFPALNGTPLKNGLKQLEKKFPEILSAIRPKNRGVLFGESSTIITTEAPQESSIDNP